MSAMDIEILEVLRHLVKAGCPTEILGCQPSKTLKEEDKLAVLDAGRQLLFQRSDHRQELLRWIDTQIFKCNERNNRTLDEHDSFTAVEKENKINERVSCLVSGSASDGLFGLATVKVEFTLHKFIK